MEKMSTKLSVSESSRRSEPYISVQNIESKYEYMGYEQPEKPNVASYNRYFTLRS